MRKAGIIAAVVVALGAALAMAQRPPSVPNADADEMMSNVMISGFDPAAGLGAAQALRDPTKRVEVLRRPGTTTLERVMGGHRAQAILKIDRLPAGLDRDRWPGTALIGSTDTGPDSFVLSSVALSVDGCAVAMPDPPASGFAEPRSVDLGGAAGRWTLTIRNNADGETYTAVYRFDDRAVVTQRIDRAGSTTEARLKIDEDDFGAGRDCIKLGRRTAGTRAEVEAGTAF